MHSWHRGTCMAKRRLMLSWVQGTATLLPSPLALPDTHILVLPSQPHSLAKCVMSV